MYPASFDYTLAESAVHAVELLSRYGEGAKLLSGGQSLIPLLKLRLVQPTHLVDIGRVTDDLAYVRSENGFLSIGALTTHAQVGASQLVADTIPLMAETAWSIGDPQVRGWGTVGGALAEADPAGDWGPALLAVRGEVECMSAVGKRSIQSDAFFVDAYTTRLADDEMITGIRVPVAGQRASGVYLKLERRAGDFAVASVALQLELDEEDNCGSASIALGAAGLKPVRAVSAEASLKGQTLNALTIKAARREIVAAVEPLADVRGSEAYKRAVCGALFEKALDIAVRRHRGEKVRGGHVR